MQRRMLATRSRRIDNGQVKRLMAVDLLGNYQILAQTFVTSPLVAKAGRVLERSWHGLIVMLWEDWERSWYAF
jgi:hypothetical protein